MTDGNDVKTSNHNRYLVKSLVHASRVLEAFQSSGDVLRLRDVVTRTGFNKGMCFRLLYTLHHCGFLDKVGENHYRLAS
ncbi:MAG: helix-turn-helix domain-containing protein, partial [Candidatus Solibacter sp.]|nr:helix-turn-helix domain-containing protein [Candidatus Solibacter sp.]